MPITELHDRESGAVDQPGKTVLIEFYTDWCPTCRAMKRTLEIIAGERNDLDIYTVNTDENPGFVGEYEIKSVPTFLALRDKKIIGRASGAIGRRELEEMLAAEQAVR